MGRSRAGWGDSNGKRITLIDDAIDIKAFKPGLADNKVLQRDSLQNSRFQVGLVGHIRPAKKQLEFLQTIEYFCRTTDTEAIFFIIGDVHSQTYMRELQQFVIAHQLQKRVIFTGNRKDMPAVLSALDVLVSLSGGSVMFEGMACGICVVSAGFTSKKDVVHLRDGNTGVVLGSHQPEALSTAIDALLKDSKLRKELGGRARKWVEKKLDWCQMATDMRHLYAALLEENQGHR